MSLSSEILEGKIEISADIKDAKEKLLNELFLWFQDIKMRHANTPWQGIHDEGTYLLSFRELLKLTIDESKKRDILQFLEERLKSSDKWLDHHLKDGYWSNQEAHHGIEHFCIYLNWMREVFPDHPIVKKQVMNASRHIIEKVHKKKPWYDTESKRFISIFLGSRKNGDEYFNVVEHLRFVRLAWFGYIYTKNKQLYDFMVDYSNEWKQAIVSSNLKTMIPTYLEYKNIQYGDLSEKYRLLYRKVVGAAPKDATIEANAELHIANGTVPLFFHLYNLTQDKSYLKANKIILNPLLKQLQSPFAHPLGPLFYKMYTFGFYPELKELESQLNVKEILPLLNESKIIITKQVNWKDPKYHHLKNTVGMRKDMPEISVISKDGKPVSMLSPGTLNLLYQITHNEQYCIIALDYTRTILNLVKTKYDDGRKHGCGSQTVSAFCIGHGRNWSAGYVATALRSLIPNDVDGLPLL